MSKKHTENLDKNSYHAGTHLGKGSLREPAQRSLWGERKVTDGEQRDSPQDTRI